MANEIVKETLHPDNNDNIDIYPKTSYDQIEGTPDLTQYPKKSELESDIEELGFSKANNLENGTGTGSLVQKRLKSDGVTWTTAKAYQGAGAAFGGDTQAGRTEEEFNAYFWDSVNNVPLHGGKGKNSLGEILDNTGLTYSKAYSFAFAANENNEAIARSSAAFGRYNRTYNTGEFVCGNYAEGNRNAATVFVVGGGVSPEKRHNAFEVRSDHSVPNIYESKAFVDGKVLATKEYVDSTTALYRHEITTTDLMRSLVVINNSDAKITKFTDLLNGNYISMSVKATNAVTPAIAVNIVRGGTNNNTKVGIQVRYYDSISITIYGEYLDSKLLSDTITKL